MASKILGGVRSLSKAQPNKNVISSSFQFQNTSCRGMVTTTKGELLPPPLKTRFGLVKVLSAAVPGIIVGATLAKNGAAWLEENEIFIPDDDDDD